MIIKIAEHIEYQACVSDQEDMNHFWVIAVVEQRRCVVNDDYEELYLKIK